MIGRSNATLGLAVSDRGIACAEVAAAGSIRSVRRTAMFTFTAENSLENSTATGQALASFLRENRFSASRCVVGVPARWLIAAEKDVPPVGVEQARAMLRIQAERQSGGEAGEMVFDYTGETSTSAASRVLMVGIGKLQLDRVSQLIDAAGLSIAAITSTGLAMAGSVNQADRDGGRDWSMLLLQSNGGEVIVRANGNVKMLRHVPFTANGHGMPPIAPLGAELRRTMALGAAGSNNRELTLMNGVGLAREQLNELSERAGVPVRSADEMKLLGLSRDGALAGAAGGALAGSPAGSAAGGENGAGSTYIFPAVSLALAAGKVSALPLDFAHSKLAPLPVRRFGKGTMYAAIGGAILIIGVVALYLSISARQSDLARISASINEMKKTTPDAQRMVDRVSYAKGYFESRPAMLECIRQLSLTFPQDRIWVDTLTLREKGNGTLNGKSADQQTVLDLMERLKKNPKFSDVGHLDVHETDQRTHEWTFSINFTFNLAE